VADLDERIAQELTYLVGHGAPFSDEELAGLEGPLTITCPRSIEGLERCRNLRTLSLFAGDFETLAPLRTMTQLERLQIACSRLTSLDGIGALAALQHLEVNFTLCRDAGPLAGPRPSVGMWLVGNPWDDASWARLSARPGTVLSPEGHWRLTRRLCDEGVALVYGAIEGRRRALIRPGVGLEYMVDLAELDESEVERALAAWQPGGDAELFFDELERPRPVETARPERFWQRLS